MERHDRYDSVLVLQMKTGLDQVSLKLPKNGIILTSDSLAGLTRSLYLVNVIVIWRLCGDTKGSQVGK